MSVTIQEKPPKFAFSDDYLLLRATSTNTTQTGFRYSVTIDVNGTEVHQAYLHPNNADNLVVDLSLIIKDYVTVKAVQNGKNVFTDTGSDFFVSGETAAAVVDVAVQEYYSDALQGSETSYTFSVVKGYGRIEEGLHPSRQSFIPNATAGAWLSEVDQSSTINIDWIEDAPGRLPVILNANASLNAGGAGQALRVIVYNGSTMVDNATKVLSTGNGAASGASGATPGAAFITYVPAGFATISALLSSFDHTTDTFTHATIQACNSTATTFYDPILQINKADSQCKHKGAQVIWANRVGGFDTLMMDSRVTSEETTQARTYVQKVGGFGGDALSLDAAAPTIKTYHVDTEMTLTVSKVSVTVEEMTLVRSLVRSRLIMLYYNDNWVPVTLQGHRANIDVDGSSMVRGLELTFKLAQEIRC